MRLFVAIEIPERLRISLIDLATRSRRSLPPARWVPSASLHLTLAFLGDVAEEQLVPLARALVATAGECGRFDISVSGSGCFPPHGKARVAWFGFTSSPELLHLERRLAANLRGAVRYERDRGDFTPHLTIARCSPPWPSAATNRWTEVLPASLGEPLRVDRFALIESRLSSSAPAYRTIQRFALGEPR